MKTEQTQNIRRRSAKRYYNIESETQPGTNVARTKFYPLAMRGRGAISL
jgi:hypothetical protein